ncbi:F-box/LRR-repeat protein 12 [Euphorbia peplus]|nr:F-box/LRR-repeat protein 12 [Euphorbia peplus]
MENHLNEPFEVHSKDSSFTSIVHLSDDLLHIIFQFLDCHSDRESFGLTCHRWLNIQNINRRSLQFQCSFSVYDLAFSLSGRTPTIGVLHLRRLLARFRQLTHLSLCGCTNLPDTALTPLPFVGSQLESLFLDCCFDLTDNGLSLIATSCPFLTLISLYRCKFTDAGLQSLASGCSNLKRINLSNCGIVSDVGLGEISRSCHQLEAVIISCCDKISGTGFSGCSPTLTYIEAESCKLQPKGISGMVSGGGLEYLDVSGISTFSLAGIGCGLGMRIRILNMRMCRDIGDESIIAIAKGCPLLEEWNLALCHEVRIPGWESIGKNCNKLEKLHVNRCRNLCNTGFQALREGCKSLSVLYMSTGSRLSPSALMFFRLSRGNVEIREEEIMCIGADWNRWKSNHQ